jgi:Type I restriction-modification system methyltransferase subunit
VTELVARLAGQKPGDRICDPACGSGGLLIQAAQEVPRSAGSAQEKRNVGLFGQESNGQHMGALPHEHVPASFDSARVEWCDTLNNMNYIDWRNPGRNRFHVTVEYIYVVCKACR